MRILEATIAVMLVSGVLVVVYSNQVDRGISPEDYFYGLQQQILTDISSQSDLRLAVLNVEEENFADENFEKIYNFTDEKVPDAFGFSLRVCDFGSVCKMNPEVYISTTEKDIFVKDVIISSELGDGSNVVSPNEAKKLRFFIWAD